MSVGFIFRKYEFILKLAENAYTYFKTCTLLYFLIAYTISISLFEVILAVHTLSLCERVHTGNGFIQAYVTRLEGRVISAEN